MQKLSFTAGYLLLLTFFGLWEALARSDLVDVNYMPPVSVICETLWGLVSTKELTSHAFITLKRVILGFGLGGLCGFVLGFACGYIPRVYGVLELTVESLRPMPSVALIPVGVLFLGIGDSLNVAIIAWACSWPVFINTMIGVRSTEHVRVNTARTFGYPRAKVISRVILPACLPYIFTGLRIGLGIAVSVVVITEMVASGSGLGYFIRISSMSYQVPQMYAGIITVGMFGYLLNKTFLVLENRMLSWHHGVSAQVRK
jgi:NitT/TauT family transport system permease protein